MVVVRGEVGGARAHTANPCRRPVGQRLVWLVWLDWLGVDVQWSETVFNAEAHPPGRQVVV